MQRFAELENVGGFLTPDGTDGLRKLYDLKSKTYYPFETAGNTAGVGTLSIGRFHFLQSAFEMAKQLMHASIAKDWIVIDEVGKLEVEQHKDLEPELSELIAAYKSGVPKGQLLLVVRESLLEQAIEKYALEGAIDFSDLL